MPTTTPFNNLITFSRGSNATLTGPNGLIQWAPNNLLTFSEQFDNAAWTKVLSAAATANTDTAPDGTITADTVIAGAANSAVRQTVTTQADSYTFSCWVKRKTGTGDVQISASGGSWVTQAVTSSWQRFSVTQSLSAGSNFPGVRITTIGDEVFLWGAQLEIGSTATTYNPTTVKNLLGFSEAFDNAGWNKVAASIVAGAQANPVNGLFNAQKLMEDTTTTNHQITQGAATTANPFTFSSYVKAAGRNWAVLAITDSGSVVRRGFFNLATGAVGTTDAGITASITSVGSGWYRCAITIAASLAGTTTCRIYLSNDGVNTSYTGDGNSGVYIYGAQLSDSASLGPYVPTPGAAPSSTAFYGPRFDFDPVTLLPRGILIEEQRTNNLTYSEDWSNAVWSKNSLTVSANVTTAPNGTTTADKLIPDAAGSAFFSEQPFNVVAGTTYTGSIFLKAAELSSNIGILFGVGGLWPSGNPLVTVNLATGVVSSSSGALSTSITNVGNGWYRITLTQTASVTGTSSLRISPTNGVAGNGVNGIFAWGAQSEVGAFATSYIPTIASTVTRSADVATITGQNFAQWFNAAEGAIVISADTASWASIPIVAGYNPSNTASFVYFQVNTANTWNGTTVLSTAAGTVANNVPAKAATAYTASTRAIVLNGGTVASDTNSIGTASVLALGAAGNPAYSSQRLNGHIQSIRFIPARAADFQLQALST